MAKAFGKARGVTRMVGPLANKIVVGRLVEDGVTTRIIPEDDGKTEFDADAKTNGLPIDPISVTYSTGFVDFRGNEIFEGDYLDVLPQALGTDYRQTGLYMVFFDSDVGAFKMSAEGTREETTSYGDGVIVYGQTTGMIHAPLTADIAAVSTLQGSFYKVIYDLPDEPETPIEIDGADEYDAEADMDLPVYDEGDAR